VASMLTLEVARRTWWLWIIPVSAVVALIVMNPQGFMALLVATGTFIWGSILNVFNWLFAALSWAAQAFIALFANFWIGIVNWIIAGLNRIPGLNIPTWPYLKAPSAEGMRQIAEHFAAQWQVVKAASDAYITGVQEKAPGIYLIGGAAGGLTGGGLYLASQPEKLSIGGGSVKTVGGYRVLGEETYKGHKIYKIDYRGRTAYYTPAGIYFRKDAVRRRLDELKRV